MDMRLYEWLHFIKLGHEITKPEKIEVTTDNKFRPYSASWHRQDGFVATHQYWERVSAQNFRFRKAERFVELLIANRTIFG